MTSKLMWNVQEVWMARTSTSQTFHLMGHMEEDPICAHTVLHGRKLPSGSDQPCPLPASVVPQRSRQPSGPLACLRHRLRTCFLRQLWQGKRRGPSMKDSVQKAAVLNTGGQVQGKGKRPMEQKRPPKKPPPHTQRNYDREGTAHRWGKEERVDGPLYDNTGYHHREK